VKEVRVEEAVGMVLAHDLTKIVPGEFKGRLFKKGHIICEADVPELLNIGKEHIFILELPAGRVHEDEAAIRLAAALRGPGVTCGGPAEGKVSLYAERDGLFCLNREAIMALNSFEEVSVATIHGNVAVQRGEQLAGTRVVPLVVPEELVSSAESLARHYAPLLEVRPFNFRTCGLVTTGSEVFNRRIEDRFTPVVLEKLSRFPSRIVRQVIVNDEKERIKSAVLELAADGAQLIIVTGGMSVDPDDRTPAAIRATGAQVVTYGTPVLPGSMLMLAYLGEVPVLGLPGCVMFNKTTVFDLILPRLFAGERLTRQDFTEMAVGGLCGNCEPCRYPRCHFGKN
jgi:hypothetical protein